MKIPFVRRGVLRLPARTSAAAKSPLPVGEGGERSEAGEESLVGRLSEPPLIGRQRCAGGSETRPTIVARFVVAAFFLAMTTALGRVVWLQVEPPLPIRSILASRERALRETPPRADLLDRLGRPLAVSRPGWRAFVDPARLPADADARRRLAAELAGALDAPLSAVAEQLAQAQARSQARLEQGRSPLRYARLSGPLNDSQVEAIRALAVAGVHLERVEVRQATPGLGLAPIVGKVGLDGDGLVGAERAQDQRMRSSPGALRVVRDARGAPLWLERDRYHPPMPGATVRLTIDAILQRMAVEELWRGVVESDAAGGRIVALEPSTGEILALADVVRKLPDAIDLPNGTTDSSAADGGAAAPGSGDADNPVRYRVLDPAPPAEPALARLRAVEDIYEPGSTFKPFVWSAITERGLLAPTDVIDTEGGVHRTPYGRVVRDVVARDEQSWENVLVNSSNVGMVKAATRLTPAQLRDAILAFGFGSRTGVNLPAETPGIVTPLARWNRYTHTSVAFGQEVGVSALQMVRAFAVFARTGELTGTIPQLRLVAGAADPAGELLVRVLSPETVRLTTRTLRSVAERASERLVEEGVLDAPPRYSMFGKSGTADMPHPHGVGYLKGQYISSFIASAPADEPAIVVLVVIDDPGPGAIARQRHYGSWTAGPAAIRFAERALPYLGASAKRSSDEALADAPTRAELE